MKSFSEYIKEAYSFRLGGSQQKGFDQNVEAKNMSELKVGDEVYFVAHYYDTLAHKGYVYKFENDDNVYLGFDVSKYDTEFIARRQSSGYTSHPEKIYTMFGKKYLDNPFAILNDSDDNFWIISTSLEALSEVASKMLKKDELIDFEKSIPIARDEKF